MLINIITTNNKTIIQIFTDEFSLNNGGVGSGIKGHTTAKENKTISIKGNELGEYKDIKELREKAKNYYKEHFQGTIIKRNDIGEIRFSRRGIEETINKATDDYEALQLIPHLQEIIETSKILNKEKPNHERKDITDHFLSLQNKVNINGKEKTVEILLKHEFGYWHYCLYLNKERTKKQELPVSAEKSGLNNSHFLSIIHNNQNVNNFDDYELNIFFID